MARYAKVRFGGNPKLYVYRIPEGALKLYTLGTRVRVPTQGGKSTHVGEIIEHSDDSPDVENIHDILGTAD